MVKLRRKELQLTDRDLEAMVPVFTSTYPGGRDTSNLFWEGRQDGYLSYCGAGCCWLC